MPTEVGQVEALAEAGLQDIVAVFDLVGLVVDIDGRHASSPLGRGSTGR